MTVAVAGRAASNVWPLACDNETAGIQELGPINVPEKLPGTLL